MPDDTFMDAYAWLSLSVMGLVVVGGGVSIISSHIRQWCTYREIKRLQRKRDDLVNLLINEPSGHPHHHVETNNVRNS